jgi:hypothetical protein
MKKEKTELELAIATVIKAVRDGEKNKQSIMSFVCNSEKLSDFDSLLLACKHADEKKLVLDRVSQTLRDCRKRKITIQLDLIAPKSDENSPYGYQLGIMKGKVEYNKIPKPLNKSAKNEKLDDEKTALQQAVKIANIEKSAVLADNDIQQKSIDELTKKIKELTAENVKLASNNAIKNRHLARYKNIVLGLKNQVIDASNLKEAAK